MKRSGSQIDQLQNALLDAFPSEESLRRLVRVKLNKNLAAIAGGENLMDIIFNLITWAEANGQLEKLITGAYKINPGSKALQQLKQAGWLKAQEMPIPFIADLWAALLQHYEIQDWSRVHEFAQFDFIGARDKTALLETVAFVKADDLDERGIVTLRDRFFDITQNSTREFNLKPRGRNPNGLLGFVFEAGCPPMQIQFIYKQSKISHSATRGALIVPWVLDLKSRQLHTHKNPVSIFPPVIVFAKTVFPDSTYLQTFLETY